MEPESRSGPRTTFKHRSNGDIVVTESVGSGLRKFVGIAVGIGAVLSATFVSSWTTSIFNLDIPQFVPAAAWFALFSLAVPYFVPAYAVLRVSADSVTVRLGQRPKQVIPMVSIQFAELVLRSPGFDLAVPDPASEHDRVYGQSSGYAVRIHYIDEDLSVRGLTFVTSEARRVLDALKQCGARVGRK